MAQLFTVYFPQYCFEIQKEFSITFSNATNLPLDVGVSYKGVPHITHIHYDQFQTHRIKQWTELGLKEGLRIVSINSHILVTEQQGGINTTSDNDIITRKEIQSQIDENGTEPITFTFSEDIPSFDDSEPLGLTYIAPPKKAETQEPQDDQQLISFDPMYTIKDNAISVSSFKDQHVPEYVRLNYPGFWSPTDTNTRSRDVWICIDLGAKKEVDMIQIQGNADHSAYVESLWIEYSDDMCAWKSHPMRCIKCQYIRADHTEKEISGNEEEKHAPLRIEKTSTILPNYTPKTFPFDTATIKLWPVIHAQFIRIRPVKWKRYIAMRLELLGNDRPSLDHQQIGKVVTANTVCAPFKQQLLSVLVGEPQDTSVIQIDCKAIVTKAMDLAGCTSYSLINTDDTNLLLVVTTPNAVISDRLMDKLTNIGVGRQFGVISSIPVEWRNAAKSIEQKGVSEDVSAVASTGFAASVKSHKKVQVVVERIMNSASLTFDYSCMLLVASMIAVGGLATDSAVIVVASMLVSPIMGPVLAFTFGVTLSNWPMARLGLRNECISLLTCVFIGFVVGFFYVLGTKNRNDWPTNEMASRGDPWALSDGAFIAFVSGVGVALSVLGDYLSTVVGVAISASLLPPAVNCGMLLGFCIYETIKPECVEYPGCGDTPSIHDYNARDTAISATISLVLTIENIILIFIAAWIMFKIKDIVETKDRNQRLWDYISQFKAQHKKLNKSKKQHERGTSVMKQLREQTSERSLGAHGNYQYDVFTSAGSKEEEAIGEVKKTVAYAENDIIHSTLKGALFKQVSTFYHHQATSGSDDRILSDVSAECLLSPKETKSNERPTLSTIFSQAAEHKPLMHDDEGDDVENVVLDTNDQ